MADVPFSTFVSGLSADTIGGSEKIPVIDTTPFHITPDLLSAYVIDQIVGADEISALTDSHQFPVFTSADVEKVITGANLSAWIVDEIEDITTGTSIVSGDTVIYNDGGVLKQIDIDTILAYINTTNGTLGAQIAALDAAVLANTDQYVVSQSGTAAKTTFADIASRVHSQFNTFTAALDAVVTATATDKLYIIQGSTAKYVSLTVLLNSYLVGAMDIEDIDWNMSEADPAASGDMLLMQRGTTRYKLDVDTLVTYASTGLQASILDFSGLTADTPASSDLFVFDDGDPKKITLANLETQLWSDYATYVGNLTAVVTVADNDKFYCIQSGTPKYVTPVELATYLGVSTGDVSGPVSTTEDKIPQWDSTNKLLKDGLDLVTTVRDSGTAVDTAVPTEQAVREALSSTTVSGSLDIDGTADVGEALAGTDLFLVDHGANGTNRSSAISRIKTYIETAGTYDGFYVDAATMFACATNGATAGSTELGNGVNLDYFAFDSGATEERVQFRLSMPEEWDRSLIKVKFFWSSSTGSTTGDTVEWAIKAVAISNNDVLDATFGSAQAVSDELLNDNGADLQYSGAVELDIGGTPQLGDLIVFEVYRNTDGTDDMTEDAWLFGVEIQYQKNKQISEWSPAVSASPSTSPSTSASTSPSTSPSASASTSPSASASSTPSSSPSAT